MNVLICGGRNYNDHAAFDLAMGQLNFTPTMIIQGGAKGADTLAKQWAISHGVHYAEVPHYGTTREKLLDFYGIKQC